MPRDPLKEVITDRDALVLADVAHAEPEAFFSMIRKRCISLEAIADFLNRRVRRANVPVGKFVVPAWDDPERDNMEDRLVEVFHSELLDPWPKYPKRSR